MIALVTFTCGVLVLLGHGAAAAQDLPPTLRPLAFTFTIEPAAAPPKHDPFEYAMFTYGATAGADWAVTAVCVKVECAPKNPGGLLLATGVPLQNPKVAVPIGLALDVLVVLGVKHWLKPNHPTAAQVVLYSLSAVRLVILTQRISDLRRNVTRTGERS